MKSRDTNRHPSAIGLNQVTPQSTLVHFTTYGGIEAVYDVLDYPEVLPVASNRSRTVLYAKLRNKRTGEVRHHPLANLGIVREKGGHFHPTSFCVPWRKRHLLPLTHVTRKEPFTPLEEAVAATKHSDSASK